MMSKMVYWMGSAIGSVMLVFIFTGAHAEGTPPANRISLEKARKTATQAYAGSVQGEELEFEGGKWLYSFDLKKPKDKNVHEVQVDALSGKVLDVHVETAADESKELQQERAASKSH
jgi:hypothetical protein